MTPLPPACAWLGVFLPALAYFLSTRVPSLSAGLMLGTTSTAELGTPTTLTVLLAVANQNSTVDACCRQMAQIFFYALAPTEACRSPPPPNDEANETPTDASTPPPPLTFATLSHPLQLVQSTGLDGVVDVLWRHDSETLGRGYLLLSESSNAGRIWRWEVGGGPIAIGKTLHLDQAGCRSSHQAHCHTSSQTTPTNTTAKVRRHHVGSGAMAIDFYNRQQQQQPEGNRKPHATLSEGLLLVVEWGERRIVRLEENGARTPIQLHVPSRPTRTTSIPTTVQQLLEPRNMPENDKNNTNEIKRECDGATTATDSGNESSIHDACHGSTWQRMPNVERMVITPTGDLILAVNYNDDDDDMTLESSSSTAAVTNKDDEATTTPVAAFVQLPYAVHTRALTSLQQSRQAHAWTHIDQANNTPSSFSSRILTAEPSLLQIGGLAIASPTSLYAVSRVSSNISNEESTVVVLEISFVDDEDNDYGDEEEREKDRMKTQSTVLWDLAEYAPGQQKPGSIAVSNAGTIFVSVQDGVLVLNKAQGVLGKLITPGMPTAMTLGGDGYLYIATSTQLYRIRTMEQRINVMTNQVKMPPKEPTSI